MPRRRKPGANKRRSPDRALATHVPLAFALRAWRHCQDSGGPLLRAPADTDLFTIRAYQADSGGPYSFGIEEYHSDAGSLTSFRKLASFIGLAPEALVDTWLRRGLPEEWLPEDFDDELPDPYCFLDELEDLIPVTTVADLLTRIPECFELSPSDARRLAGGVSPPLPEPLGEVVVTQGVRPGDNTKYYEVSSALAVSCLQFHLDAAGCNTIVKV